MGDEGNPSQRQGKRTEWGMCDAAWHDRDSFEDVAPMRAMAL